MRFLLFLSLIFFSDFSLAQVANHVDFELKSQLRTVDKLNKRNLPCGTTLDQCSPILKKLVKDDQSNAFFGILKNQHKTCSAYIQNDKQSEIFKSSMDLNQNLAQHYFKEAARGDASVINRCLSGDVGQSKEAVSKYYYQHMHIATLRLS